MKKRKKGGIFPLKLERLTGLFTQIDIINHHAFQSLIRLYGLFFTFQFKYLQPLSSICNSHLLKVLLPSNLLDLAALDFQILCLGLLRVLFHLSLHRGIKCP